VVESGNMWYMRGHIHFVTHTWI